MGMADYIMGSVHDLLASDSESISDSISSQGSYHPSHECFMTDSPHHEETPEGRVKSSMVGKLPLCSTPMTKSGRMRGSCLTRC
jgi:hypothetical protein